MACLSSTLQKMGRRKLLKIGWRFDHLLHCYARNFSFVLMLFKGNSVIFKGSHMVLIYMIPVN